MAEMPTWTLTYHARPMSLNVERAGNRFQRAPLVKEWRGAYRWLAAEDRIPPLQWIHVEARPQYRTARSLPDTAACVGSVKAAIDGLVDAGEVAMSIVRVLVDLGRIGSRDGAWMSNSPAAALLAHLEAQP